MLIKIIIIFIYIFFQLTPAPFIVEILRARIVKTKYFIILRVSTISEYYDCFDDEFLDFIVKNLTGNELCFIDRYLFLIICILMASNYFEFVKIAVE